MKSPFHSSLAGLLLGVLLLLVRLTGPAEAAVQPTPTPSPANATVSLNQASSFSVAWRLTDVSTLPRTVFSDQASFLLGGTVIATVNRRISQTVAQTGTQILVLTENVVVPRSVAAQAAKSNQPLTYQRVFSSTDALLITQVSLPITIAVTGIGGDLLLSRIELTFEAPADARFASVDGGEQLRAIARIRFGGSGVLRARWVLADPSSTAGRAIFRTLQLVQRNLPVVGVVEILSPPLPTEAQGIYELRFEVDDPAIDRPPRLLYQVRGTTEPGLSPDAVIISLSSPEPRGALDEDVAISWSAAPGAVAYKIVFLESLGDDPADLEARARHGELPEDPGETRPGEMVAGFYLPGDRTDTVVPGTSMTRLSRNTRYYLQVLGWGRDGSVVGRSEPREVLRR